MRTRERMLPVGWYPASPSACKAEIDHFIAGTTPLAPETKVYGGIVPHAGWYFSGKAAARVFYLAAKSSNRRWCVSSAAIWEATRRRSW